MTEPTHSFSPTEVRRASSWVLRRAALGTAAAIIFGAALGALIGSISPDPLGWMLGGAGFGAIGGPVFGLVEALVIPAGTSRTGWSRCMAVHGGVGGVVFGGVALVALGSAAPDRIIPELGELLGWGVFGAVTGVVFGGIVGAFHALSAGREERVGRPVGKQTHRMDEV
jgi:hypothetical protein